MVSTAQSARGPTARRVKLSFTDSAEVRRLRNQYGSLTELQPNLLSRPTRSAPEYSPRSSPTA